MIDIAKGLGPVMAVTGEQPVGSEPPRDPLPHKSETDKTSNAAHAVESLMRSLDPPLIGRDERLSISRDEATGTFVYRSINKGTGEVLRQWPAESMLQFKAYLRDTQGVMFDTEI